MMNSRTVSEIVYAPLYAMGDLEVRQPLPSAKVDFLDPFILLHHAHVVLDTDTDLKHVGVGPHPHRGFSPVTFVFKGATHHRDSRGHSHVVEEGGTQWMHAGMGIIHSERPASYEMEIIQLWINVPSKFKFQQPAYFPLAKNDTPVYFNHEKTVEIRVVSGSLMGISGPVPSVTPVNAAMLTLQPGGKVFVEIPEDHNCFIYLLDGKLKLSETREVTGLHMAVLGKNGNGIQLEALEPTRALLMSGEPIEEKLATHGPFVMNNETEIMEAYRDYRMGKMGILIEE